jgi:hypothetical protein
MDDQNNIRPTDDNSTPAAEPDTPPAVESTAPTAPPAPTVPPAPAAPPEGDSLMNERLERLGGEPAPVITPEEFARLQQAGQVHIDALGRVQTARRSDAEAGVSLRKRRAWYT